MSHDPRPHEKLVIGVRLNDRPNAVEALRAAREDGFKFVTSPADLEIDRFDVVQLDSKWWTTSVIGQISSSSDLAACLQWSQYMDLPATILPPDCSLKTAAILTEQLPLRISDSQSVWIPFPLSGDFLELLQFYNATGRHRSINVMICFENLSSSSSEEVRAEITRNLYRAHVLIGSVPVAAIHIPTDCFLTNPAGYPALSKAHQALLSLLLRRCHNGLKILLDASNNTTAGKGKDISATGAKYHLKYLQNFRDNREELKSVLDSQIAATEEHYLDALQQPLQPLKDHLPFQTYETFETDPVKYTLYEQAIQEAASNKPYELRILVAGAGRGPLVQACLDAVPNAACIYAVEKNPGAIQFLRARFHQTPIVKILRKDIRSIQLEAPVDIIVSELLGSFGCNELSPECINRLFENPSVVGRGTISIPANYTSMIAPMCSTRLHQASLQQSMYPDPLRSPVAVNGVAKAMETPYVVRPCSAAQMHQAMECWSFDHSPQSMDRGIDRFVDLTFSDFDQPKILSEGNGYGFVDEVTNKILPTEKTSYGVPWLCTGLVGSFTSQLHGNIFMSTEPHQFSVGMFSWFPLFFPLHEPLLVPVGASLKVQVWRKHDAQAVWYEWCVQVFSKQQNGSEVVLAASPIHNPGGRSYRVSLLT